MRDEDAVVVVQRHHVRHCAECDQIQQVRKIGFGALAKMPTAAQLGAQREHDVENHAAPGQRLAGKRAAGLVGIDDDVGIGQRVGGQMMVGNQRDHAPAARQRDALKTGDAVIDGNQQTGLTGGGQFDNGGT